MLVQVQSLALLSPYPVIRKVALVPGCIIGFCLHKANPEYEPSPFDFSILRAAFPGRKKMFLKMKEDRVSLFLARWLDPS